MIDEENIFVIPEGEEEMTGGQFFLDSVKKDVRLNGSLEMITDNDGEAIKEIDDTEKLNKLKRILEEYSKLRLLRGSYIVEIPPGGTYSELSSEKKKTQDLEKEVRMEELKQQFLELLRGN